jgi:hypothetical protein
MRIKSVFRSDIRCRGASRRLADWLDHGATVAPLGVPPGEEFRVQSSRTFLSRLLSFVLRDFTRNPSERHAGQLNAISFGDSKKKR